MAEVGPLCCGVLSIIGGVLLIGTDLSFDLMGGIFFLSMGIVLMVAGTSQTRPASTETD